MAVRKSPKGTTTTKTTTTKTAPRKSPARPASTATPVNRWLELRRSPIQGTGGFARRRIPKGTRIIEYTGQRISQEEADRRYDDEKMKRHHTFLFALDNGEIIDAAVGGNEARFINHSCDPNCEAVEEDDRIFIEAKRAIEPGEELAYDYAFDRADVENIRDAEQRYVCRCGSPKCRGTILAPEKKKRRPAARTRATSKPSGRSKRDATATRTKAAGTKTKATSATKTTRPTRTKAEARTTRAAGSGRRTAGR